MKKLTMYCDLCKAIIPGKSDVTVNKVMLNSRTFDCCVPCYQQVLGYVQDLEDNTRGEE